MTLSRLSVLFVSAALVGACAATIDPTEEEIDEVKQESSPDDSNGSSSNNGVSFQDGVMDDNSNTSNNGSGGSSSTTETDAGSSVSRGGTSSDGGSGGSSSNGGSSSGGSVTIDPNGCDWADTQNSCEAVNCENGCNAVNAFDTGCPDPCNAMIECLIANPGCGTAEDPTCSQRRNGLENKCTLPWEQSGAANDPPGERGQVLVDYISCLCGN